MEYEQLVKQNEGKICPCLLELMDKYKYICSVEANEKPNYKDIPVTAFNYDEAGIKEFNNIYTTLYSMKDYLPTIVRTRSKGISFKHNNWHGAGWDVRILNKVIEITFCFGAQFRFQIRNTKNIEDGITGSTAFKAFRRECAEWGIDLNDFAIDNGAEVKKEIEKAMIDFIEGRPRIKYLDVHHLDFNSAWPAGIVEDFPELEKPIKSIYDRRKFDKTAKAILTHAPGYMQSDIIDYKFASIAKSGINNCNKHMREMLKELKDNGRKPLLTNTDGIWYQGEIYHNSNEGTALGQWKHDYINCEFRARSKGAYEFIGTDVKTNTLKFKAVVRGYTNLDKLKPREDWEWGDIFNTAIWEYTFKEGTGVVKVNDDE